MSRVPWHWNFIKPAILLTHGGEHFLLPAIIGVWLDPVFGTPLIYCQPAGSTRLHLLCPESQVGFALDTPKSLFHNINPHSFAVSLAKLQQLAATLRNCSYFGGIISYFYYPGKTPAELTLTNEP